MGRTLLIIVLHGLLAIGTQALLPQEPGEGEDIFIHTCTSINTYIPQ